MRLRAFMAAPDKPIPDVPMDWRPPSPRADTPPPGEEGVDAAMQVSERRGEREMGTGTGERVVVILRLDKVRFMDAPEAGGLEARGFCVTAHRSCIIIIVTPWFAVVLS